MIITEIIPWPPPIGPGVKLAATKAHGDKQFYYQDVYIEVNGSTVFDFQRKAEKEIGIRIEREKTNVTTKDKN